ncbi:flavodoxin family protein [Paenibacillus xanthanilyticus]|uniref:Flavodoxin family protein n=1 Tax=Paenibacillus xanthanilyticus TaxID=1783531 RepID=A0ABV8K5Y7_9BACL
MGIAVLYGSSRRGGNSDLLADRLVEGKEAARYYLSGSRIEPIIDYRHTEPGAYPEDDYRSILDGVLGADTLVIATPIYWYGISAPLKLFIDRWSQSLREDRQGFLEAIRGKRAYLIAVGDDEPGRKGLPIVEQFRHIFDFVGVELAGYALAEGNKPGDVLADAQSLAVIDGWRLTL